MKIKFAILLVALAIILGAGSAMAQIPFTNGIINVDFYYYTFFPGYGPGAGAIGSPGDQWNQVLWPTYSGQVVTGLKNTSGTTTTVGLKYQNTSSGGGSFAGTYGALFGMYDAFTSNTQVDQITGLTPNATYYLYLFDPNGSTLNVNGVSFSSTAPTPPANSLVLGIGYSVNIVTADSSGNLDIWAPSGSGSFSAMQLMPVPPPPPVPFTNGIINLDFYISGWPFYQTPFGPGMAAIGGSGDQWNGLDLQSFPQVLNGVKNNTGATTTVGFDYSSSAAGGGSSGGGTYASLFDGYANFTSAAQVDQITGLTPNAQYNLYLYSPNGSTISVNGVSFSCTAAPRPEISLIAGIGYSVNIVTADSSGNLHLSAPTGNGEVSALQLSPVSVVSTPPSGPLLSLALAQAQVTTTNASGTFGSISNYPVGNYPGSVVAFKNAAGRMDIACVNFSDNSLTLLTNGGSGIFSPNTTVTGISSPWWITAADVNGDGFMDLICVNLYGNSVSVLTNNGSGGFGNIAVYPTDPGGGDYPTGVAAFTNVNGRVDLVCANFGNYHQSTLSVLTNDGTGKFNFSASYPVGSGTSQAYAVTTADINGDGKQDLVCVDQAGGGGNTLWTFTNNGTGGFALASTPPVGSGPISVTAADLNNDGWVDLISANGASGNGNTLTVLTNDHTGHFSLAATPVVGHAVHFVTTADLNKDGWVDLVCGNANDGTLSILTNNATGGFALSTNIPMTGVGACITAADVNGDGNPDLISANNSANSIAVLVNAMAVTTVSATGVVISWPSPSTGFVLQQNGDLTTTNWTNFGGLIHDDGTTKSATNLPPVGSLYYRLKQ